MRLEFCRKTPIALAVAAAVGAGALAMAPTIANAEKQSGSSGKYVAGDFHNHTTCSDGSISMEKLVNKAVDTWGLDWFVQAGHGGNGNRNCTLVEDATLATPAYPVVYAANGVTVLGPTTTWQNSNPAVTPKGLPSGTAPNQNMWRWQSIQEFQYPLIEYLNAYKHQPLFIGIETVVPGHEHTSMSVITGQIPASLEKAKLPTTPGYAALGNATALAQWEYCFDRGDTDTSRGDTAVGSGVGNNWDCSVPGSLNAADVSWNATAQKLMPSGTSVGVKGHNKTVEALKWMVAFHPKTSYYVPAHLERAGPFNPNGNNGFNIESLRDFNNAAPNVAFGFESQPGHGASNFRGEYQQLRNGGFTCTGALTAPGATTSTTLADGSVCVVTVASSATTSSNAGTATIDSVGGTTYGGTGVYAGLVGGVWDALLGEGRNWWFFASSDWHNRGSFGADDRRSTQDFQPGEYQRNYTLVRDKDHDGRDHDHDRHDDRDHDKYDWDDSLRPQAIVNGLRSGNSFATGGQLIDRLSFIACSGNRSIKSVEALAVDAAVHNTVVDADDCANMGEKLKVEPGEDIVVAVVVRDPAGANNSPYTFANPSLLQAGITQPLNKPALDHIDLIRGMVTGYKTPGSADYSGEWPRNKAWLHADGTTADLSAAPVAAKNTSAAVVKTFNDHASWTEVKSEVDRTKFLKMSYRIPAVRASQYVRLRGTNMPSAVPYETDVSGNPLSDTYTNAGIQANLKIPCNTVGTTLSGNAIDGCPVHLPTINGQKYVAYDVAAWSDLWFYSNPIYVQVKRSTLVAGVN